MISNYILNQNLFLAIVTFICTVLSVYFVIRQLKANYKASTLSGFNEISYEINKCHNRKIRHKVYKLHYNNIDFSRLNKKIREDIDDQIVLFDQMGCLINKKLIKEDVAIEIYWDVIIRFWDAVECWIYKQRLNKRSLQKRQSIPLSNYYLQSYIKIFNKIKITLIKLIDSIENNCLRLKYKNSIKNNYKFYPYSKPKIIDYGDTHYENFQLLVWRCEKYCFKRGLDRPSIKKASKFMPINKPRFCFNCKGLLIIKKIDNHKRLICNDCGTITYINSKPCVAAIIIKNDKILLTKRNINPYKDYWDLPGGFLENGEDPIDGLKRELKEELKLNVNIVKLIDVIVDEYGENDFYTINTFYLCNAKNEPRLNSKEILTFEWIDINKLPPKIAFKSAIKILNNL